MSWVIELSGALNEHGPIKVTGAVALPQPQPQPQPQPVVNPVGGALVVGGGVPVAALQSPVSQPVSAQPAQPQSQQPAAQPAPQTNAAQPAVVSSPLNVPAQPQAQPPATSVTTANAAPAQPAPQANAAQPPAEQPAAVAEVQSAQPAQQAVAAQPAKDLQAVGAQAAVGVARGGQPANAPALTTTAQPASAQPMPWAPIAAVLTLIGLGAAGALALYRKKAR